MSNIAQAITRLRADRKQAQRQVEKLTLAINVLEKIGSNGSYAGGRTGRAKRVLSAAGRRRISLAQKARWARMRQTKKAA